MRPVLPQRVPNLGILSTAIRYHTSLPIGNKLTHTYLSLDNYAMRGNTLPQPIRRLTTKHTVVDKQPKESLGYLHWVKLTIFGILWVCLGIAVTYMRSGGMEDTLTRGAQWDPAGNTPFNILTRLCGSPRHH